MWGLLSILSQGSLKPWVFWGSLGNSLCHMAALRGQSAWCQMLTYTVWSWKPKPALTRKTCRQTWRGLQTSEPESANLSDWNQGLGVSDPARYMWSLGIALFLLGLCHTFAGAQPVEGANILNIPSDLPRLCHLSQPNFRFFWDCQKELIMLPSEHQLWANPSVRVNKHVALVQPVKQKQHKTGWWFGT